jgi:hypothetical protein
VKQPVSMLVFLLFLLSVSITVVAQDFESLLEKAKNTVTAKSPTLELVSKRQERENEVVYQWKSSEGGVRLLVFFGGSEQEATEKMRFSLKILSMGAGERVSDIGDEAYLARNAVTGRGIIRFRKSNVYVDLSAPSVVLVQDLAKDLANLIQGK